jgi:hypothetical protein
MNDSKRKEKVLLITRNDDIERMSVNVLREVLPEAKVVKVETVDEAIEKIMNNGFTMTVLDSEIPKPQFFKLADLLNINYVSCKNMILISTCKMKRTVERQLGSSMKKLHIWNVYGKTVCEQMKEAIITSVRTPPKSSGQMFDELYSSIQSEKKKRIFHPLLMFV